MAEASRHSIKVPRLFKTACKIAKLVKEEGESLKDLVYSGKHPNIKALYALVVQTLQHGKELDTIFEKSKILEKEKGLDPWLARVLITELTWGKKRLLGESKPVKTVLSYKTSFEIGSGGVVDAGNQLKEIDKVYLPRYARVNTLYMTVEQAVDYFRNEGWLLARRADGDLFPSSDHFRIDTHIPDVLVFPPRTQLYQHPLYRDHSILLQDKASCLAAHLLDPPPGSTVLDMCAAPGMKTTMLAARMGNKGTLYAVEKDPKRYKTLCNLIEEAGATCVKTLLADAIQLKAEEVPDVEYILVDPSCSGTGMVSRPKISDPLDDSNRLRSLVRFQSRLLVHALTSFPKATRVVYSTCSMLQAENEGVVAWALQEIAKAGHPSNWRLSPDPLTGWNNRGCDKSYPGIGECCLYSCTETDLTNGFFLAIFERTTLPCSKQSAGCQKAAIGADSSGILRSKKDGGVDDRGDTITTKKNRKRRKGEEKEDSREATITAKRKKKKKSRMKEEERESSAVHCSSAAEDVTERDIESE